MSETVYTYSIINDFVSLAVPSLNLYGLELKIIENQSITVQISGISNILDEDEVYITFQDSLTLQQKNDLDDIISSYTGLNESFNDAIVVKFEKQELDKFYIQSLDSDIEIDDDAWTDVCFLSGSGIIFHEATWKTDTHKILLKVIVDNETCVNVDLEMLRNDFGLKTATGYPPFPIYELNSNVWRFKPPAEILADTEFKIQMKSKKSKKEISDGLVVWRRKSL